MKTFGLLVVFVFLLASLNLGVLLAQSSDDDDDTDELSILLSEYADDDDANLVVFVDDMDEETTDDPTQDPSFESNPLFDARSEYYLQLRETALACDPCDDDPPIISYKANATGTRCQKACYQLWAALYGQIYFNNQVERVEALDGSNTGGGEGGDDPCSLQQPPNVIGNTAYCDAGSLKVASTKCNSNGQATISWNLCNSNSDNLGSTTVHENIHAGQCANGQCYPTINSDTATPEEVNCTKVLCEIPAYATEIDCIQQGAVGNTALDNACGQLLGYCKKYRQCVKAGTIPSNGGAADSCIAGLTNCPSLQKKPSTSGATPPPCSGEKRCTQVQN